MSCYRIRVIGKVQGVFFRASTKEKADVLGIVGWARNESDGSVLIEAEGEESELEEFISWCHSGPPMAVVDELKIESIAVQGFQDFRIAY